MDLPTIRTAERTLGASNANTIELRATERLRAACGNWDIEAIEHVIATELSGNMGLFLDLLADGLATRTLVLAASGGKVELVRAIGARYPEVVNERFLRPGFSYTHNFSPLEIACYSGHEEVAVALLDECSADVNLGGESHPPLFLACKYGHEGLARSLLARGADVSLKGKWDHASGECSPFAIACEWGRLECAKALMELRGAQIDLMEVSGLDEMTPIIKACLKGHLEVVRYLHEDLGIAIPEKCGFLQKPLLEHIWKGRRATPELIQYLGERGATMDVAKAVSKYVLEGRLSPSINLACWQALFTSVQIPSNLFSLALSVPFYEGTGAEGRYSEVCEMLRPYVSDIAWATFFGYEEVVDTLLDTEDPNRETPFGTLIEIAALLGEDRVIDLLIERGADPNPDCETSPLELAVRHRHHDAIRSLIRGGANTEGILRMRNVPEFVIRYLAQIGRLRAEDVEEDDPRRALVVLPAGREVPSLYEMARRVAEFQDEEELATLERHLKAGD